MWKYLVNNDVYNFQFLIPVPTMLYCLHNYNLLDKAANEHPSKNARFARHGFVIAQIASIALCVILASYFFNVDQMQSSERFATLYYRTFASVIAIDCIC